MIDFINVEAIQDLRDKIHFNDNFVHISNVLQSPITDWDEFQECMIENNVYDCSIISKMDNYYSMTSTVEINVKDDAWERRPYSLEKPLNGTPAWNPKDYFENRYAVIIKNFDEKNQASKQLLRFLLETFYINLEDHGVWPAFINQYSGHAHLNAALKGSNFDGVHADPWTNFIFIIDGELEVDVYKNRTCTLMDHSLNNTTSDENLKKHVDSLEFDQKIKAKTNDLIYVPNRLMHRLKPTKNVMYINLPLILKGPMAL